MPVSGIAPSSPVRTRTVVTFLSQAFLRIAADTSPQRLHLFRSSFPISEFPGIMLFLDLRLLTALPTGMPSFAWLYQVKDSKILQARKNLMTAPCSCSIPKPAWRLKNHNSSESPQIAVPKRPDLPSLRATNCGVPAMDVHPIG